MESCALHRLKRQRVNIKLAQAQFDQCKKSFALDFVLSPVGFVHYGRLGCTGNKVLRSTPSGFVERIRASFCPHVMPGGFVKLMGVVARLHGSCYC